MPKLSLELTLKNGRRYEFQVDSRVAEAVAMHHVEGGVFFHLEGREVFSVDFQNVLAVHGFPLRAVASDPEPPAEFKFSDQRRECKPPVSEQERQMVAGPDMPKELYKIECKCGAEYFCNLFSDTQKCRCRECGLTAFVDKFEKRTGDNNRSATLITNRYRVPFTNSETA